MEKRNACRLLVGNPEGNIPLGRPRRGEWIWDDSPILLMPLLAYFTNLGWWILMRVEQPVECLAGETAVLGDNLPQFRFVNHKSHMTWPGHEPGPPL
jgi:hypothetical protein